MGSVTYDNEGDILYVALTTAEDKRVARSDTRNDLRIIDYAADGRVLGVEFINVSDGIDLSGVPEAETILALVEQSGHSVKILA